MAMLERNEKGKQVRRYFIRVEKKYKEQLKNTTITYQYPVSPAAMEGAANLGRLMKDDKRCYISKIIAMLMKLDGKTCRRIYLMVAGMSGRCL